MNRFGIILIIIGAILFWCGASADNYHQSLGDSYPLTNMVLWVLLGGISFIIGCRIYFKEEK